MTWQEQYDTREAIRTQNEEKARAEYKLELKKGAITEVLKVLYYLDERTTNGFFYRGTTVLKLKELLENMLSAGQILYCEYEHVMLSVKLIEKSLEEKYEFIHVQIANLYDYLLRLKY